MAIESKTIYKCNACGTFNTSGLFLRKTNGKGTTLEMVPSNGNSQEWDFFADKAQCVGTIATQLAGDMPNFVKSDKDQQT